MTPDWLLRLLHRLRAAMGRRSPSAWDYFFDRTRPLFLLVTLNDGGTVTGRFGSRSLASPGRGDRDLYVESVYTVADDGPWTEAPWNAGIWIPGREIKHIEFWEFR